MNILFACSELYPLVKTGGLADVTYNLPRALHRLGHRVRLVLPAYRQVLAAVGNTDAVAAMEVYGWPVTLLQTCVPSTDIPLYLVDCPPLFDRDGGPYGDYSDQGWPDNARRFGLFGCVVAAMAGHQTGLDWQPDILHCNDWQAGLAPTLVAQQAQRPAMVFTIHNLAYQGLFSRRDFEQLQLPETLWDFRALEFHGCFSFIKGGIVFADAVNTVSPSYAAEVLTAESGCGLDGLLRYRGKGFSGILNGIDTDLWNPIRDPHIAMPYDAQSLTKKTINKQALLADFHLPDSENKLLLGMVARLTEQKGVDLLLEALPELLAMPLSVVVLGSGDPHYTQALQAQARRQPGRLSVHFGYDEGIAHRLIAGADALLIPSRYEPCGLTQMYAQHYGTVPIASAVGGLADTIVDLGIKDIPIGRASGLLFHNHTEQALVEAVQRALGLYRNGVQWRSLQMSGMARDFSWRVGAEKYMALYRGLVAGRKTHSSQSAVHS